MCNDPNKHVRLKVLLFALGGLLFSANLSLAAEFAPVLSKIEKSGGWFITETKKEVGSKVRAGVVYAVIEHPKAILEKIVKDYENYPKLIHFLRSAKILSAPTETQATLRFRAEILKGTVDLKATLDATVLKATSTRTVVSLLKTKGNVKNLKAVFTLDELGPSKTLVSVTLHLDPDLWYVRNGTLSEYNQVNARRITRALKQAANQPH